MNAIDTNMLARYLRDDDPDQSRRAARLIQRATSLGEPLLVNHVVLAELAWILDSVYEHTKEEITSTIEAVLHTAQLRVEDPASVAAALDYYRTSKAGFADCLIGRRNRAAGCRATISFDRRLRPLTTFEVM